MGVLNDLSQLIEDQTRLKFQRGCQGMRDLQQRGLLMGAGFYMLVEVLFFLNPFADITDNTQQGGTALICECRPSPFCMKRGAIPTYVQQPCIEHAVRLKRSDRLTEYVPVIGVYKCRHL